MTQRTLTDLAPPIDSSEPAVGETFGPLLACEHCDTLHREPRLARGDIAYCRRCEAVLYRGRGFDADTTLALVVTTAVVFLFANVYPVIRLQIGGMHSQATLWQAALAMAHGYASPVAVVVATAMIFVPGLQIASLGWLAWFARSNRRAPGFIYVMRGLDRLRPWSMVEVFLLGALVAIVKLAGLMEVTPGIGIVALALLTCFVTLLAGRGTRSLWHLPEGGTR